MQDGADVNECLAATARCEAAELGLFPGNCEPPHVDQPLACDAPECATVRADCVARGRDAEACDRDFVGCLGAYGFEQRSCDSFVGEDLVDCEACDQIRACAEAEASTDDPACGEARALCLFDEIGVRPTC